ncbi:MAG TPA: putative oxidoreductase C-terminal domain-containing protein [Bryobacteraceae bacterium]|nr:putative oxidoreductase C-terminal domain-containing protein [Bryobacteraceae bacterium]
MNEIKLITLNPGHFHAALVQKEMYPDVSRQAAVYGPLGPDLLEHLGRVVRFNVREESPTAWELDVRCSPRYLDRMLADRPGNVVVIAGRNRAKIDLIHASVQAGFHVLADKPWIIETADLPKLEETLETAERKGLAAYDIMTERYEITSIVQRALVNDDAVFGEMVEGSEDAPAVLMESVHHLMKTVAGVPLRRPPWFFDIREQGEGLTDVGPHLVDLVQWVLFPEQAIDHRIGVRVLNGRRWPTVLSLEEYQRVTGERRFPDVPEASGAKIEYFCNNSVLYRLRGVHVKLTAVWNYEAPPGAGDTHCALFRGTKARVEIRQGAEEGYRPELYVVPEQPGEAVGSALRSRVDSLASEYAGIALEHQGARYHIVVPEVHRVGHEAHFAQVARQFFRFVRGEGGLPACEKPNMLTKYFVTTQGVALSRL